jgi:hypothetical protein
MTKTLLAFSLLLFVQFVFAANFFSKGSATDFNSLSSWGSSADGSGAAPASFTLTDTFVVANNAKLVLTSDVAVGRLKLTLGKLTISGKTLTVGFAAANSSLLTCSSGGFLEISSGTLDLRGAIHFANGSGLTQTGGLIKIDGNNKGDAATSVPGGLQFLGFGTSSGANLPGAELDTNGVKNFKLSGGTVQIVDGTPSTIGYQLVGFRSTGIATAPVNLFAGIGHTFVFGDGVSTDPTGVVGGLNVNVNLAGGIFSFGNIEVNVAGGTNRFFRCSANLSVQGNFTIKKGAFVCASSIFIEGNLINNDSLVNITSGNLRFERYTANTTSAATANRPITVPQTISGNGVFINAYPPAVATANLSNLTINNTSGTPISLPPFMIAGIGTGSISGVLALTNGRIDVGSVPFIMGISETTLGSTTGSGGVIGEVQRWIPAATGSRAFPLGSSTSLVRRNVAVNFTEAAATPGIVSVKFTEGKPTALTAPFTDGTKKVNQISPTGFWTVTRVSGSGGTYSFSVNATDFTQVSGDSIKDLSTVALIKKNANGLWAAGVEGATPDTIPISLASVGRAGNKTFADFAIGLSNIVSNTQTVSNLKIFDVKPNPTSGLISFSIEGIENEVNVVVRNMMGQAVMSEKFTQSNDINLDLQALNNGIYILEVKDIKTNNKISQRIIKH